MSSSTVDTGAALARSVCVTDELLPVELLEGQPSGESQASLKKWLAARKGKKTIRQRPRV